MAPQEMGERPGREKKTEEPFSSPIQEALGDPFLNLASLLLFSAKRDVQGPMEFLRNPAAAGAL